MLCLNCYNVNLNTKKIKINLDSPKMNKSKLLNLVYSVYKSIGTSESELNSISIDLEKMSYIDLIKYIEFNFSNYFLIYSKRSLEYFIENNN